LRGALQRNMDKDATVVIERMGQYGEGVGRMPDGRLAFVKDALPGETVDIRVTETRSRFVRGAVVKRHDTSHERVQPVCPIYQLCGGCTFQHWQYQAELRYKEARVKDALERIAHLDGRVVQPIRANETPYGYRNKGQFPFGRHNGRTVLGLYRRGSHEVVDLDRCAIQDELVNTVLKAAESLARASGLPPYDEVMHTGVLRHLLVRTSRYQGRALVLWVVARVDPALESLARELMKRVPAVEGVGVNVNADIGNRVLGSETRVLAGESSIVEEILGLKFRLSFTSFFQVNPQQAALLYATALDFLDETTNSVWDLYSGVGTLAILAATRVREVRAIEINADAVADALDNVRLNGLTNVRMEVGAVEQVMSEWVAKGYRAPDAVIVDPPRKGLDASVIDALLQLKPRRIVYISCQPETWARDVRRLSHHYQLTAATPVDMFSRSDHVEVASALELQASTPLVSRP
jgi:23S rRNA (uracil1939-C5)-methyltransferase